MPSEFMIALGAGDETCMRVMSRDNVNEVDAGSGITFFMLAALIRSPEVVLKSIELGADMNARDYEGNSALIGVCRMSSIEERIMTILSLPGIMIDFKNDSGMTALMYVCMNGDSMLPVVNRLLELGADPHSTASNSATALLIACASDYPKIAMRLLQIPNIDYGSFDAYGDTSLFHAAACDEMYPVLVRLIELGASLDAKDLLGNTALHMAAVCENVAGVRLLLKYGSDSLFNKAGELAVDNAVGNTRYVFYAETFKPKWILSEKTHECDDCVICMMPINDLKTCVLPCGHMFHTECALRWFDTKSTSCPTCRCVVEY